MCPSFVLRTFDTLIALLVVSILASILLGASVVFASEDSPFYFDESGKVQQHGHWSPMLPNSNRYTEADQRAYQDWRNAETLRKNDELIENYHAPKPIAPLPSYWSTYGPPSDYSVTGPDGRSQHCQQSFSRVICQ